MENEMRVGIVSCYFQRNYGSMLQAYATQMALDRLGYMNETIDVSGFWRDIRRAKIKYFVKASLTSDILLYKFGMAKSVLMKRFLKNEYQSLSAIREQRFDSFCKKYFRMSERYPSKQALAKECANRYSAVVVGSDQLWLPGNIAADYYTLNFVPRNVNTIAYATSFGQAALPPDSAQKASVFLKKIRHISTREKAGQRLIQELSGRRVPVVCDPVLLFSGEEWMRIQYPEPLEKGKYILCYFLGKNPACRRFSRNLREKTGYRTIVLPHLDEFIKEDEHYGDEKLYNVDPADFLNLIRNAEYICTDSFHCTAFSILYRKKFFTFRRFTENTRQSTNSRIESLLHLLELPERMLFGTEDIEECLQRETDFEEVHKKLELMRKNSFEYLLCALRDEGNTDL